MTIASSLGWKQTKQHPSSMASYFAPTMPFHPEELYKQLKHLESIYLTLDSAEIDARTALAKAIVAGTASLIEGCLHDLAAFGLSEAKVPDSIKARVLRTVNSLSKKSDFLKSDIVPLRGTWSVAKDATSEFIEGGSDACLRPLRNKVDHGGMINQAHLRLDNITDFRKLAIAYLRQVYASMNVPEPGWFSP